MEQKQVDPNALYKAIDAIVMDGKVPTPREANSIMTALSEVLTIAFPVPVPPPAPEAAPEEEVQDGVQG